jgi:hypothetical protein
MRDALSAFFGPSAARPGCVVGAAGDGCFTATVPDRRAPTPPAGDGTGRRAGPRRDFSFARPPGAGSPCCRGTPPDREEELLRTLCRYVLKAEPLVGPPAHDLGTLEGVPAAARCAETWRPSACACTCAYPGRLARRRVALETLPCDGPLAVEEMLREHAPDRGLLDALEVSYAELQVDLRVAGGVRPHAVRLWPDHA